MATIFLRAVFLLTRDASNAPRWYKRRGNRGLQSSAMMLFYFGVLACALLLSSAVSGLVVESHKDLQKRDKPKGIDVSDYQPNVDWGAVKANGNSFVYIKATEGTGNHHSALVVGSADISS